MHVIGDDVSHGSFLNRQVDDASSEEIQANVDFDSEATEVHTASANHLPAATAMTTHDTEIQKYLKVVRNLVRKSYSICPHPLCSLHLSHLKIQPM